MAKPSNGILRGYKCPHCRTETKVKMRNYKEYFIFICGNCKQEFKEEKKK